MGKYFRESYHLADISKEEEKLWKPLNILRITFDIHPYFTLLSVPTCLYKLERQMADSCQWSHARIREGDAAEGSEVFSLFHCFSSTAASYIIKA